MYFLQLIHRIGQRQKIPKCAHFVPSFELDGGGQGQPSRKEGTKVRIGNRPPLNSRLLLLSVRRFQGLRKNAVGSKIAAQLASGFEIAHSAGVHKNSHDDIFYCINIELILCL